MQQETIYITVFWKALSLSLSSFFFFGGGGLFFFFFLNLMPLSCLAFSGSRSGTRSRNERKTGISAMLVFLLCLASPQAVSRVGDIVTGPCWAVEWEDWGRWHIDRGNGMEGGGRQPRHICDFYRHVQALSRIARACVRAHTHTHTQSNTQTHTHSHALSRTHTHIHTPTHPHPHTRQRQIR